MHILDFFVHILHSPNYDLYPVNEARIDADPTQVSDLTEGIRTTTIESNTAKARSSKTVSG